MLVDINEVEDIVEAMKKQEANSKNKAIPPEPQLFKAIHHRIYKILKQNYLPEFYSKVLQIPTKIYRQQTSYVGLRFNSCGDDIIDPGQLSPQKDFGSRSGTMQQKRMSNVQNKNYAFQNTHKPVNIIDHLLKKNS